MSNTISPTRPLLLSRTVTAIKVAFWFLSGVFLLIAFLSCVVRPDFLTALTLVPAWLWPLLGVITCVWGWLHKQRKFALLLALTWAVFTIGWVEEPTPILRALGETIWKAQAPAHTVRIVSLNCANTARVLDDLKQAQPDIVLLQEVPGEADLAQMAKELFGSEGHFLSGSDSAILARGQIVPREFEHRGHFVSGTVTLQGSPPIACVSLRLTPPVSRLDFWVNGFWTDHRDQRETHRRELQHVRQGINTVDDSSIHIIGGDFNMVPLDRAFSELAPGFSDAYATSGFGPGGTGTNEWPLFRVDQI